MIKNRYFPALVTGFAVGVLTTIPVIKSFACCMLVPAAGAASVFIDQKLNNFAYRITTKDAALFGLTAGIFAAIFTTGFEALITYIVGYNDLVLALPQMEQMISEFGLGGAMDEGIMILRQMAEDIENKGFSLFYTLYILASNLMIDAVFGILGGIFGMAVFNRRFHTPEG